MPRNGAPADAIQWVVPRDSWLQNRLQTQPGRVQRIDADAMLMDQGTVTMEPDTLYVDCTASAINHRPSEPVFQGDRIVIQLLRAPLVSLSAAMTAYIEVHGMDEAQKNQLCAPVPFPNDLAGYARTTQAALLNQFRWSQEKTLRQWMRGSRLDSFGRMVAELDKGDVERQAVVARLRANAMAAMGNFGKLM
jgi:hypothetical protein